jgi:DNA primase
MTLSPQWLDQLRERTTLSTLIGKAIKLKKKGREFEACCPFHHEKTPSFTINDDKGFYHCFGCGAHGDAIRWMVDSQGLQFIDAVKELAALAGLDVPARSEQAQQRDQQIETVAATLQAAAGWYAQQLQADGQVVAALADRGIDSSTIERFGLGFAPPRKGVAGCGAATDALVAAGLLVEDGRSGAWRDFFRNRVMIPVHDARGRVCGFAGRIHGAGEPKYINSSDSDHFAKGDLLFNLHRAAPPARSARRLIMVEGQFDVVALDRAGIGETVAPMGTAVTERQLERAWRVAHCPVLLFDGDAAGRKAALRAAERAMPHVGPGKSLAIAQLPQGEDPDSLVRSGGRDAIEAAIAAAVPLSEWLFDTLMDQAA